MKRKQLIAGLCAGVLAVSTLFGCGAKNDAGGENQAEGAQAGESQSADASAGDAGGTGSAADSGDVEIWCVNEGYLAVEKGSETWQFYKDLIGGGIIQPYVEWNGGTTYQEQLNLRIAAGEMPDMFTPVNGMEADLIASGALLDLTDLLPEYAPNLWNAVPQEIWDAMRANDRSGEGGIYTIPNVINYGRNSPMIRNTWSDH